MTLRYEKRIEEKIVEAQCDRCGESLVTDHAKQMEADATDYAVLEPSFGYFGGLDLIQEGPNAMKLYFCEKCYRQILAMLGLAIGCNPEDGYHWTDPTPSITVGDPPGSWTGPATNVVKFDPWVLERWPYLKKKYTREKT